MQTPTPASQATRARKPKAPAIPALMPKPRSPAPHGIYWAVAALNDDAYVQALNAISASLYGQGSASSAHHTKQIAMVGALMAAEAERDESFVYCTKHGGLPFAWRGSRALLEALPSSLRSAA